MSLRYVLASPCTNQSQEYGGILLGTTVPLGSLTKFHVSFSQCLRSHCNLKYKIRYHVKLMQMVPIVGFTIRKVHDRYSVPNKWKMELMEDNFVQHPNFFWHTRRVTVSQICSRLTPPWARFWITSEYPISSFMHRVKDTFCQWREKSYNVHAASIPSPHFPHFFRFLRWICP